jgi:hypothetical protein
MDEALRCIHYSINETKLPDKLVLNEDIDVSMTMKIPKPYGFEQELAIIEKNNKAKNLQSKVAPPVPADKPKVVVVSTAKSDDSKATSINKPNPPPVASASSALTPSTGNERNDPNWYADQMRKMGELCGQNSDVCQFYLESVDWDLGKAIDMYRNMVN